jgi:DNA polymerase-3 subunit chi
MTEIRFYHLQRKSLEEALPELLEKVLERNWRAVVLAGSRERAEQLDQHLWVYGKDSFLPHGSARDGFAEDQPVWLTSTGENPNGATVLVLVDGMAGESLEGFERVCDLFDGNDPDAVDRARERWRHRKAEGHQLSYWQQGAGGGWRQKA